MSRYNLYLRGPDLVRIGEIATFTSLDLRLVFAGVSRWILDMPADQEIAAEVAYGRGLIVERNGEIVLSGPIEHIQQNLSNLQISGPDDTVYLQDKLAYPVPAGPPYSGQAYDVYTSIASTVMRYYVNYNVGPSAQAVRQQAGLVLETPDPLIGVSVTGRARFENLLELIQSLAIAGGDLGFRIVQSEVAAELIFQVYQPADKTLDVIFSSKLGNLRDFQYSTEVAEANYIIVGGGGEGTARVFYEKADSNSIGVIGRRIEQFRDRRDTSVVAELEQSADEELSQKAAKSSLSITPIDTSSLSFPEHYKLGDKVTVVADVRKPGSSVPPAITIQDVIREIRLVLNESGDTIEPSIGTPESGRTDIFSIFTRQSASESRISNLERR